MKSESEIKQNMLQLSCFIYLNGVGEDFPTSTKVNSLVAHVSPSQSVEVSEGGGVEGLCVSTQVQHKLVGLTKRGGR